MIGSRGRVRSHGTVHSLGSSAPSCAKAGLIAPSESAATRSSLMLSNPWLKGLTKCTHEEPRAFKAEGRRGGAKGKREGVGNGRRGATLVFPRSSSHFPHVSPMPFTIFPHTQNIRFPQPLVPVVLL